MTDKEKQDLADIFEAMGGTDAKFQIGQVVGSQQNIFVSGAGAQAKAQAKAKAKASGKQARQRELMTFKRGKGKLREHYKVLYAELCDKGWILCDEEDFQDLFSGEQQDLHISWISSYGRGTLRFLFEALEHVKALEVPAGFSLEYILEGHFVDKKNNFLTGMHSSGTPNNKALPEIKDLVKLMTASLSTKTRDIDFDRMFDELVVNDTRRGQ